MFTLIFLEIFGAIWMWWWMIEPNRDNDVHATSTPRSRHVTRARGAPSPCSCNHVVHFCRSSLLHDQPESKSTHAIPEGVTGISASAMLTAVLLFEHLHM